MKRNRNWLWFFLILIGLTATAIGLELWYNLNQQLRPQRLAAARQLWKEKGPASYQAQYLVRWEDGSELRYAVWVEEGQVVSVTRPTGRLLAPGEYPFDRIETLFDHMDEQLRADARPDSPRVFATGVFDPQTGCVLRYVRSVRKPRERLEVNVLLRPLPPEDGKP
jgi:hypothetical protein